MTGASATPSWIQRLLEPAAYPHPVGPIKLIETHISWVFLTGSFAYKVKKPCKLEFLDFSTLERREHFCAEEIRLNRRFAPGLYLEAVPITGSPSAPRIDGEGEPIEWAVKLVQFDEANRLDARFEAGRIDAAACRELGEAIAHVQAGQAVASAESGHGTPQRLRAVFRMNLDEIRRHRPDAAPRADAIEAWLEGRLARDQAAFAARIGTGRIRECHGDLHLANLVLLDGHPVAFDSIEFNPDLRWIDVASDIAFLSMDLESRGRPDLAAHVTSAWMEAADDRESATVLPVHRVARAVVRAAVAAIRSAQADCPADAAAVARRECDRYLDLAERLAKPSPPLLLVTTGVSGSGKTTLAAECVGAFAAVRLRSDVERKRLFSMAATDRAGSDDAARALYAAETTRQVYERLAALAHGLLEAGASVVVDATCNARSQRELLAAVARETGSRIVWLEIDLPADILRARVAARAAEGRDPSDATPEILHAQLAAREPLQPAELVAGDGAPAPLHLRLGADDLAARARFLGDLAARLRSLSDTEKPS
jgi:aminoglycoside phosphotransferase family enzyme/predicted kinase